ncbi:carbohydrate ABC transporter permease [Caldicellulosiruptoraceae bacterium PP1]
MKNITFAKKTNFFLKHINFDKIKIALLGRQGNDGIIFKTIVYYLLISVGFIYLYPILFIVSQSFKSLEDLLDPTVVWMPRRLYLQNYIRAFYSLKYIETLAVTMINSFSPAIIQMFSCALVGYGFARFRFPFKNILFGIVLFTFIIPTQVIMIPLFITFFKLNLLGSPLPNIIQAIFAGGLKSALFILIYRQFFTTIPPSLIESAKIDGANELKIFYKIVLPISIPAMVVVFLFSLVWHWNETYMTSLFLGDKLTTLPLKLQTLNDEYSRLYLSGSVRQRIDINESIRLAATMLIILPLLILYLFAQKWFVEGIERTGITGE